MNQYEIFNKSVFVTMNRIAMKKIIGNKHRLQCNLRMLEFLKTLYRYYSIACE